MNYNIITYITYLYNKYNNIIIMKTVLHRLRYQNRTFLGRTHRQLKLSVILWTQHVKAGSTVPLNLKTELAEPEDAPAPGSQETCLFRVRASSLGMRRTERESLQLETSLSPPQSPHTGKAAVTTPLSSKPRAGARHWGHVLPLGQFLWANIPSGTLSASTHFYALWRPLCYHRF